jgi:hypothetical protein
VFLNPWEKNIRVHGIGGVLSLGPHYHVQQII